ncbi:hypothetical protein RJ641_034880, partial [Dillenia turbinata]
MSDSTANCMDILLTIILPNIGVFFKFGCKCSRDGSWSCHMGLSFAKLTSSEDSGRVDALFVPPIMMHPFLTCIL